MWKFWRRVWGICLCTPVETSTSRSFFSAHWDKSSCHFLSTITIAVDGAFYLIKPYLLRCPWITVQKLPDFRSPFFCVCSSNSSRTWFYVNDHRSNIHNLSSCENLAWKKNSGLNGNRTRTLRLPVQCSYQWAIQANCEMVAREFELYPYA